MPATTLFDQTDIDGADTPRRAFAQKFNPTSESRITAVEVNVRTSVFDGGGGRSKRLVVLNAARSAYLSASAWSTNAFTEGVENAWNRLELSPAVTVPANTDCWLGLEFQSTDATEDRAQVRSSSDDVGLFTGSNAPVTPKSIYIDAGNSVSLLDPIDGVNVIQATSGVGLFAFRALGFISGSGESASAPFGSVQGTVTHTVVPR